jgi:hypothetical protein
MNHGGFVCPFVRESLSQDESCVLGAHFVSVQKRLEVVVHVYDILSSSLLPVHRPFDLYKRESLRCQ